MSVEIEINQSVALLSLAEPATRHALSRKLVIALHNALDDTRVKQARAIVITGTGSFFCAGANIHDLLDGWISEDDVATNPVRFFERLANDPRPTIAAVNGAALGGGFELMLTCDLAIASPKAWFCLPELAHGVIPNTGLMRLQQIIGARRMMHCVMTGQRIDAEQALSWGLLNSVADDPVSQSVQLAQVIVDRVAPGALAVAKTYAARHVQSDWNAVHRSLQELPESEWREGLLAFTEKRVARYEGFWSKQAVQDSNVDD